MNGLKKYGLFLGILPLALIGLAVNFSYPVKPGLPEMAWRKNKKPLPEVSSVISPFGIVSGLVVDVSTKEPISFAHVTLLDAGKTIGSATCDIDGKYTIQYLSPGNYNLLFEYIMYQDVQKKVQVFADSTVVVNIELKEMDCHKQYTDPPTCPQGAHTKRIVPIVYGKPDAVTKSGDVYYGGEKFKCEEYYCKKHKRAF